MSAKTFKMTDTKGMDGRTYHAGETYKVITSGPTEEDEIGVYQADILKRQGHGDFVGPAPKTALSTVDKPPKGAKNPIGEAEAPKPREPGKSDGA